MKVHPSPRFGGAVALLGRRKELRRLPHSFAKVLELPFRSSADVAVREDGTGFQFTVATDDVGGDVRAHAIEIHPGVTKVVVRDRGDVPELPVDDLEMDRWRFRLPYYTLPELALASYVDGELVVTVPKGGVYEGSGDLADGGIGRLIFVQ